MNSSIKFIYDGDCPFCNKFAQLLELKSNINMLEIIDGRKDLPMLTEFFDKGYDINRGAILVHDDEIMQGDKAVQYVCSKIHNPSDALLSLLAKTFSSKSRSSLLFPLLLVSRRFLLLLKGIPIRPVHSNLKFY